MLNKNQLKCRVNLPGRYTVGAEPQERHLNRSKFQNKAQQGRSFPFKACLNRAKPFSGNHCSERSFIFQFVTKFLMPCVKGTLGNRKPIYHPSSSASFCQGGEKDALPESRQTFEVAAD